MGRRRTGALIDEPEFYRVHRALHTLWTKAAGREDYNKKEWTELDNAISALGSLAFPDGGGREPFGILKRRE